ncbi:hypothetical protein [Listeria booriae]|nr:hypothetical protein [Listeria booriae]
MSASHLKTNGKLTMARAWSRHPASIADWSGSQILIGFAVSFFHSK